MINSIWIQQSSWLLIISAVVFGMVFGSFLNVVIFRLPKMLEAGWNEEASDILGVKYNPAIKYTLSTPASSCPTCSHKIRAWENIPLFSFLFLKGKCSGCKSPISMRYPLVELLTGALAGAIVFKFGVTFIGVSLCFLMFALIAAAFIDLDTFLLPDVITLPLVWAGLLFNLHGGLVPLDQAVIGAMAGYLSLWTLYWAFKLLTGKEGMGFGDFKLLAALGAWAGWQVLPNIAIISAVAAGIFGAISYISTKERKMIPYGPYLAIGGLAAIFNLQGLL